MKNLTVLSLAIVAVIITLYAGFNAMTNNYSYGPFVTFIGFCTAVGLSIDVFNIVQVKIRKGNVRKLGRF
jgi:hypothetical protein